VRKRCAAASSSLFGDYFGMLGVR